MNFKLISIFLVIFFFAMACVSAVNENTTNENLQSLHIEENISSIDVDDEILSANIDENVEDTVSVSIEENVSSVDSNENILGAEVNENASNGGMLSVSIEENLSSSNIHNNQLSVSAIDNSKLSSSNSQPKVSMSISNQNSKLTSVYDHVYSKKDWKSILLTKFKVKKSWSKKKRDKKIRKYWKKAMKKVNKLVRKYTKKGWTYECRQWIWDVGRSKVTYWYYLQFTKTIYYNGYGEIIA